MKRIIPIFIFALLAALPEAQGQGWESVPHYVTNMHTTNSRAVPTSIVRPQQTKTKEPVYHCVTNGEKEFFLFDDAGTFQYLGEVKKSDGNSVPSGQGIDRTIEPASGSAYRLGPWKRGSRHGAFLVKLEDGSYCTETWKWNRRKSAAPVEPTAGDIARMEEAVTRLEALMKIMDK